MLFKNLISSITSVLQQKHLFCYPELGMETSSTCLAFVLYLSRARAAVTPKHPIQSMLFWSRISVRLFQLWQALFTQTPLCMAKESISKGKQNSEQLSFPKALVSPKPYLLETTLYQPAEPSNSRMMLFSPPSKSCLWFCLLHFFYLCTWWLH